MKKLTKKDTIFFLWGISLGPPNGSVTAGIGTRTESKRDTDSVSESSRDTDSATGEFFPARSTTSLGVGFGSKKRGAFLFSSTGGINGDFLFSTGGESQAETSLVEFSLPLYRRWDERDFFFLGDDDELVTGAMSGANARECGLLDRAFSRVS